MPIKFRCPHCKQFLGISRSKAGLVTDCPTCGRTIRVPNLDGAVDPLPLPELNFKDAELAEALGALASLDAVPQFPRPSEHDTSGQAGESLKLAHASPVVAEPISPASPLQLHTLEAEAFPADESVLVDPARKSLDPLSELANLAERSPPKRYRSESVERPRPLRAGFGAGVLLLVSIVSFGCGILIGAGLFRRDPSLPQESGVKAAAAASPAPQILQAAVKAAAPDAAPADGGTITGRITYVAQNGEARSDRGARVLALPEQRSGSVKLPIEAFLAGTDEADAAVAKAALQASGGDYAIADDQGAYSLSLPTAGKYRIVFLSRYQPRDGDVPTANELHKALAPYFDRPDRLIGNVRYETDIIHVEPSSKPLARDCQFER